ncbi:hypothetical protein BBP00_00010036 [Phytophthora kernoviae]|uniref:Uncharacterized protein n=1 Tax=Phytophthora kernoviae TaxID=325452 RepID=A0A3F2RAV1_9STRA|nr:hypothetical protein BBP00_00010036 [Phytophthora kernoviae]
MHSLKKHLDDAESWVANPLVVTVRHTIINNLNMQLCSSGQAPSSPYLSCLLDPRFKTLPFLPSAEKDRLVELLYLLLGVHDKDEGGDDDHQHTEDDQSEDHLKKQDQSSKTSSNANSVPASVSLSNKKAAALLHEFFPLDEPATELDKLKAQVQQYLDSPSLPATDESEHDPLECKVITQNLRSKQNGKHRFEKILLHRTVDMNLRTLAVAAAGLLAFAQAKKLTYDSVIPFPETKATTTEYAIALKFKPQLYIARGCYPYPAIDSVGNTNAGLSVLSLKKCGGSLDGPQVYGRSVLYKDVWAIVYAWYFPRDRVVTGGQRHAWEHVIVWVEKSGSGKTKLVSVSASSRANRYSSATPPDPDTVDGNSPKLAYDHRGLLKHYLNATTELGDFQPLVMWDDMTDAARVALDTYDWGKSTVPLNEENFLNNIEYAYPWEE